MKTDQELEQLLRTTFEARAATVHDAPRPRQHLRRRTWLPMLAAAAAVTAIAAGVVIGTRVTQDAHPAHPGPRPHPSLTTTRAVPAPSSLHALRCTVPLPTAWRHALSAGTVSVPGQRLTPLAVTSGGDVLADDAADVAIPYTHKLVLVTRSGAVRTLYGTRPPTAWNGMQIGDVSTDGNWAAFAVLVGAQTGSQGPEQIELVDLTTGAHRTLRPTTPNDVTITLGPALADGAVYWTDLDNAQGSDTGRVYRYDIASRKRTRADSGRVSGPLASAGDVYWTKDGRVKAARPGMPMPRGFDLPGAIAKGRPLLAAGDTDAWQDLTTMRAIKASDGGPAITVVPKGGGGNLSGLTGHLLWFGQSVLDLRSGASASVASPVLARGGTAVAWLSGGRLSVIGTNNLPALRC